MLPTKNQLPQLPRHKHTHTHSLSLSISQASSITTLRVALDCLPLCTQYTSKHPQHHHDPQPLPCFAAPRRCNQFPWPLWQLLGHVTSAIHPYNQEEQARLCTQNAPQKIEPCSSQLLLVVVLFAKGQKPNPSKSAEAHIRLGDPRRTIPHDSCTVKQSVTHHRPAIRHLLNCSTSSLTPTRPQQQLLCSKPSAMQLPIKRQSKQALCHPPPPRPHFMDLPGEHPQGVGGQKQEHASPKHPECSFMSGNAEKNHSFPNINMALEQMWQDDWFRSGG